MKIKCSECSSGKIQKRGTRRDALGILKHRYFCKACNNWGEVKADDTVPKVLLFDIEIAPMVAEIWSLDQNYIPYESVIHDWFIISWAARWLFDLRSHSAIVTPEEARKREDRRILDDIWNLLDAADVTITHNGDNFDIKHMNTFFLKYGMHRPSHFKSIDTVKIARSNFKFPNNRLETINKFLNIPTKADHDRKLWRDCVKGDKAALDKMLRYNIQDVYIMEETYLRMRSFIPTHPNLPMLADMDGQRCPVCASKKVEEVGTYKTNINKYTQYRCKECGSLGRGGGTLVPKRTRKTMIK